MINLEWLRTFNAIFECKTITEASKRLHMTQPGVSKHLSALENHIGKKLFDRNTRKLIPTEYGQFLYTQVNNPLQELEKIEFYSRQRAKKIRDSIIIGCTTDVFKSELLDKIFSYEMYVVTHFGSERELVEALEADKIQLLVGVKKHQIYTHRFTFFKEEEFVLIGSKSVNIPEDIVGNEKRFVKWLQKQIWFVYDNNLEDINAFWETNFNGIPKVIPRYILPSYIDTIEVLKRNEGVSIVPKHLCEDALKAGSIKILSLNLNSFKQSLFLSNTLKNNSSKEINAVKDKLKNYLA